MFEVCLDLKGFVFQVSFVGQTEEGARELAQKEGFQDKLAVVKTSFKANSKVLNQLPCVLHFITKKEFQCISCLLIRQCMSIQFSDSCCPTCFLKILLTLSTIIANQNVSCFLFPNLRCINIAMHFQRF